MMIHRIAALLLLPAAFGCAAVRPTSNRELLPTDLKSCFVRATQNGRPGLEGSASLFMLVDADGAVPAAWSHDRTNLDSPLMHGCLGSVGVMSKFDGEKIDYLRGWTIACEGADCQKGVVHDLSKPLDAKLAKDSLTFADWATDTDKGWGYYYTQQYPEAVAAFRKVLALKADDVRALRGLAQTLAESGGDLKEARELAEKALTAAPKNAGTLEAMTLVCLKAKDDECVVKHFAEVPKSEGVQSRSLELASLNEPAKAALGRIEAAEKTKAEAAEKARLEALAKADPLGCYKLEGDAKAGCYVKRCFGEGATKYAEQLKAVTRVEYTAAEAIFAAGPDGTTLVTYPIRAPEPKPVKHKKAPPKAENKDATWIVKVGEMIDMKPYKENLSAYNIAKDFNACK